MCGKIFSEGVRPAWNLEFDILRLFYEMMETELQGRNGL
jgi:hypothetical protein